MVKNTDTSPAPATSAVVRWRRRLSGDRLIFAIPVIVYLVLVLLGITTSNIGVGALRQDPSEPLGIQIGASQSIRSDEWGTESPLWLGQLAREGVAERTPLSVSNAFFAQLPVGPVSSVVFFDGSALALSGWVPDAMLFAAKWWLPTFLLFLGLPIWFRQVGGSLRWGYLATILIVVAPGTAWWSGRPINTLGFAAAGCALALYGASRLTERQWGRAIAAIVVSGVLLARFPTYYQPLAIVVGIPLIVATAAVLLFRSVSWRDRLWPLAGVVVSGAAWTGALLWENREALAVGLSTLYPGDRVSTGGATSAAMVFGATNLGALERVGTVLPHNQSEAATAFTLLLAVLPLLVVAQRWTGRRELMVALVPMMILGVFWFSWGTVSWGAWGAEIPLANRVPNTRAMLGVGYIAIIAFCLFMSQWRAPRRRTVALVTAAVAALLSAAGGSSLQSSMMPGLGDVYIWACAAATGCVVYVLVAFPSRRWPIVVAGIAAASLTVSAQPVLVGLGDLRSSTTAQSFLTNGAKSMADGTVWATDSQNVDSLLTATGTPSLSGRQQIGPDADAWRALDPTGAHEQMWNRGGLHVTFQWTDDASVQFEQPYPDTIVIRTSPCELARRIPTFAHVVSSSALSAPCLAASDTFEWSGVSYRTYSVEG